MRIGFSIFLLAVGAILTFAVNYTLVGVDIHVVGWILMAAGVIGLILTMLVLMPRERRTATGPADGRITTLSSADSTTKAPPSNVG
jgi:UPF0716 family protein affecting phage T7 exclusion